MVPWQQEERGYQKEINPDRPCGFEDVGQERANVHNIPRRKLGGGAEERTSFLYTPKIKKSGGQGRKRI